MSRSLYGAALAALLLLGCAGGSVNRDPAPPPLPERYANDAAEAADAADAALADRWWRTFGDETLDGWVEEAVRSSEDLAVAATRVREARTLLTQASADLWPQVAAQATAARARHVPSSPLVPLVNDAYSVGLTLTYEVDLWDRIESRERAAVRDAEAAAADAARAYEVLVVQVVQAYVNFRIAEEKAALARDTVENDRRRAETVRARYESGLVPALDLYQAEQSLAQARGYERSAALVVETARHALNLLAGRYPADSVEAAQGSLSLPEPVPAGMPASLLERRPDLRAAVSRYRAADERVGAAHGDRLPKLALSAGAGRESVELKDLVIGDHTFWNVLGNLTYPLFNAGKLEAAEERVRIQRDRAGLEYAAAVRRALKDVEDALVTERELRARREALERSEAMAARALDAASDRYARGLDNLVPTLNARSALNVARVEKIENSRTILVNRAALHLALGGDFGGEKDIVARPAPDGEDRK